MKKLALHWKIIIGMLLGVVYGLVAAQMGWVDFTNNWVKPWSYIHQSFKVDSSSFGFCILN